MAKDAGLGQYERPASHRIVKTINRHWTFNYFPAENADATGCQTPDYDDSSWPEVAVPHTWSTYETTGELHPFIRNPAENDSSYWWHGWGWYRKHFSIDAGQKDKKVFVEFEGVQKYCKVWVNGQYLGDHKGGYSGFYFDITNAVEFGKDNVLAVAVYNRRDDKMRIPPMKAGNFNVYGGIFRDVSLVIKDRLYIPFQGSYKHEGGTFVTTPEVSNTKANVRIRTWIKNDYESARECHLTSVIVDAENNIVRALKETRTIRPGELAEFDQTSDFISEPHLWSDDDPYLYRVYSEVRYGDAVTDSYESPLGFRWFQWDYEEDYLYLNGKKVVVHGGNRHQEYPWLGDAIPKWLTAQEMKDMGINMNYNFMRTAHYPNDKIVYDLADQMGIIINEEVPNIKNQVFSREVQKQNLIEMIRRDRNHPSVMFWSMGNETDHAADSAWAVQEDPTRILTARRCLNGSEGKYVKHGNDNMGMEGLLRCTVRGWYDTDEKNFEPSDSQHTGTNQHQYNEHVGSKRVGSDGNLCTWLYADHGCDREYVNSPLLHINLKGWVDLYRIPKYTYYLWRANYAKNPMVFIHPHFWRAQYIGQKKDIFVDSNCDMVELKVNGRTIGRLKPAAEKSNSIKFTDVTIGRGTITAEAMIGGKIVATDSVVMAGEPAKVVLTTSHNNFEPALDSAAIIKADIVDADGIHVYGARNTLNWSVTGPATLVGPEIYESDFDKHMSMDGIMYIDTPVTNIIRSSGKPGEITVTVRAGSLAPGSVIINARPAGGVALVIYEPPVSAGNRKPVARNTASTPSVAPRVELKPSIDEPTLGAKSIDEYAAFIKEYIVKHNPDIATQSAEFEAIVTLFANHFVNTKGLLIADDYNFAAEHYNQCRQITRYVDTTNLPEIFKEGLRRYYADEIITKGDEKRFPAEKQWLSSIPADGKIVIVANADRAKNDIIYASESQFDELVSIVQPDFRRLSDEKKEAVLNYLSRINPYVRRKVFKISSPRIDGKRPNPLESVSYEVQKGKPVLIPELTKIPSGGDDKKQSEASSAPANHDVIVYPPAATAVKSQSYSVEVNQAGVFTEKYKDVSYAHFAFSGKAEITIAANEDIRSYSLSPESYSIPATVQADKLTFSIDRPRKLVVRINGSERLFIFADPMETNPPKLGDSKVVNIMDFGIDNTGKILETEKIQKAIDNLEKDGVLYLPPCIYQTAALRLKSDMTLYLAGGAVLKGAPSYIHYPLDKIGRRMLMISDCANVTVKGRGIIDGNGAAVRASGQKAHLVTIKSSKDILVEDVFLRESGSWNTHILYCDRVTFRNIKMINDVALTNTDGFDPDSSNDVLIEDSFIYTGDDAVAVKTSGRGGLLRDLTNNTFRNNVVLTRKSALKIGTETRAKNMNNIRFMHNQVLQSDRAMAIYCSDGADISNISFTDNHFEQNYPDNKRRMIHFQISNRKGAGHIRDILIKNCTFKKPFPQNSTVEGLDSNHTITGVKFENFSIDGRLCRNANEANLEAEDYAENVTFEVY